MPLAAPVHHHLAQHEVGRGTRRVAPRDLAERTVPRGQGADREPVPRAEDLVVGSGTDTRLARCEQLRADLREARAIGRVGVRREHEHVLAVVVAGLRDAEGLLAERSVLAEQRVDLGFGPDEEPAFHPFALRVLARPEATARIAQVSS